MNVALSAQYRFVVSLLLCAAVFEAADAACSVRENEPKITTIAGTGFPGLQDGPALSAAEFIEPSGVAFGHDGSIFVADAGAQNIRRLFHGSVTTIAGISTPGAIREQRVGGYRDGAALTAQFNRPTGLAIGKDNSIYVADSLNHSIRKIKDGLVSTVTKGLGDPRKLAIDDAGVLYVADYGSGIRSIDLESDSPKISDPGPEADKLVCGVAVKYSGANKILAYSDTKILHVTQGARDRSVTFDQVVDPLGEKRTVGPACDLAILNRDSLVFSDLADNTIRFLRLSLDGPVAAPATVRLLSMGAGAGLISGGYGNGDPSEARVDTPGELTLMPDGNILLADGGNRRIRVISNVSARGPVSIDNTGTLQIPPPAPHSYNVVVIGNSYAFTNALWTDSIPGEIERRLSASFNFDRMLFCPIVTAYRFSGSGVEDLTQFLGTYYGDGEANLIVLLVDGANVDKDIQKLMRSTPDLADSSNSTSLKNFEVWRPIGLKQLSDLNERLRKSGTALELAFVPDARSLSPLENADGDFLSLPEGARDFYTDYRPAFLTYKMARQYEDALRASGVRTFSLFDPLIRLEEGSVRSELFETRDYHPSVAGNIAIGGLIGEDLVKWMPWKSTAPKKSS